MRVPETPDKVQIEKVTEYSPYTTFVVKKNTINEIYEAAGTVRHIRHSRPPIKGASREIIQLGELGNFAEKPSEQDI